MKVVLALLITLATILAASGVGVGEPAANGNRQIINAQKDIENFKVKRIEIIWIPASTLTRARLTPELLEETYLYKLEIRDVRASALSKSLKAALSNTDVKPANDYGDLRWRVSVFDDQEQSLISIYLNGDGERGLLNGKPLQFNSALVRWLGIVLSGGTK